MSHADSASWSKSVVAIGAVGLIPVLFAAALYGVWPSVGVFGWLYIIGLALVTGIVSGVIANLSGGGQSRH